MGILILLHNLPGFLHDQMLLDCERALKSIKQHINTRHFIVNSQLGNDRQNSLNRLLKGYGKKKKSYKESFEWQEMPRCSKREFSKMMSLRSINQQ